MYRFMLLHAFCFQVDGGGYNNTFLGSYCGTKPRVVRARNWMTIRLWTYFFDDLETGSGFTAAYMQTDDGIH